MSVTPKEQRRLRASRHPTCAIPLATYEIQPAGGKAEDVCLKQEDRLVTARRPNASQYVDSVVGGFTTCRLNRRALGTWQGMA